MKKIIAATAVLFCVIAPAFAQQPMVYDLKVTRTIDGKVEEITAAKIYAVVGKPVHFSEKKEHPYVEKIDPSGNITPGSVTTGFEARIKTAEKMSSDGTYLTQLDISYSKLQSMKHFGPADRAIDLPEISTPLQSSVQAVLKADGVPIIVGETSDGIKVTLALAIDKQPKS